jgi:hypothetical protein
MLLKELSHIIKEQGLLEGNMIKSKEPATGELLRFAQAEAEEKGDQVYPVTHKGKIGRFYGFKGSDRVMIKFADGRTIDVPEHEVTEYPPVGKSREQRAKEYHDQEWEKMKQHGAEMKKKYGVTEEMSTSAASQIVVSHGILMKKGTTFELASNWKVRDDASQSAYFKKISGKDLQELLDAASALSKEGYYGDDLHRIISLMKEEMKRRKAFEGVTEAEDLSSESEAVSEMTSKINEIGDMLLQVSADLHDLQRYEHYDSYLGHLVEMLSENVKRAVKNCNQIDDYLNNLDGEE